MKLLVVLCLLVLSLFVFPPFGTLALLLVALSLWLGSGLFQILVGLLQVMLLILTLPFKIIGALVRRA